MPFDDAAGVGPCSDVKQSHFEVILRGHMAATYGGVMRKHAREGWSHHPSYLYWDLHAGPGRYRDGRRGSPLIALEVAAELEVALDAGLFERDAATAQRLRGVLGQARSLHPKLAGEFHVIVGDHQETVALVLEHLAETVKARAFGLVYADPNGTRVPIDVLRRIAAPSVLRRLDFLTYVSATNYKRRRGANLPDAPYLEDDLLALGKPYIWIREPMAQHQWTFAALSAWDRLPVPKRLGFWPLHSAEGRAIMDRLNLSSKERSDATTD